MCFNSTCNSGATSAAIWDFHSLTAYRQNLTIPKFVISGGSDEYFFLDDFWYWWDDMVGEKHLW